MMGMTVRRGIAAGLMLAALITGSVAMSGTAAAQQAGTIQTFPGPKIGDNGSGTKVSGNYVAPVAVPAYNGYPIGGFPYYGYGFGNFGFNGYGFNGFGSNSPYIYGYGYNAPYSGYGYGGYPFGYGYGGYGYTNLSGNTIVGCTPTVSFTPAFGYGYGCQQVSQYPTPQSSAFYGNGTGVAYPTVPQPPYQVAR